MSGFTDEMIARALGEPPDNVAQAAALFAVAAAISRLADMVEQMAEESRKGGQR